MNLQNIKFIILNFKYAVFYCSLLAYIVRQIITHLLMYNNNSIYRTKEHI